MNNLTHVILSNPDDSYEPYSAANPLPVSASISGTDLATETKQDSNIAKLNDIYQFNLDTISTGGDLAVIAGLPAQVIYAKHGTTFKPVDCNTNGELKVDTTGNGLATEAKQDDIISAQGTTNSLLTTNNAAITSVDGKLTVGDDDNVAQALQTVIYGRKDATPSGLRAVKTDFEGALFVKGQSDGNDSTLTSAQQVLCYGRDAGGVLDALKTDTNGRLEIVNFLPEPDLTPYTSFINNGTIGANGQSTQTIDMTGYRNLQIVGETGTQSDELGLAFYDGVSAWRSDGVAAGLFNDGTTNHFSMILRDIGASSVKIENLRNSAISGLYVSYYRY